MARYARIVVITVLTVGLMALFLRNANLGRVWQELGNARRELLAAGALLSILVYPLRAERWRRLLAPVARPGYPAILRATAIGFAANTLLPGRVGEVVRPYVLARRERLSTAAAFATVVIERLLDLLVLCLLFAALVAFGGPSRSPEGVDLLAALRGSALAAGLVAVAAFGLLFGTAASPERARRVSQRLTAWAPPRLAERAGAVVRQFLEAVAAGRRARPLAVALAWSVLVWSCVAASLWCVTRAFGIDVGAADATVLMTLAVVGVAVPTPGGVGGYHAAYQLGATVLYGAADDPAVGAALVLHLVWFGPVTAAGLVLMGRDGLRIGGLGDLARRSAGAARPEDRPAS